MKKTKTRRRTVAGAVLFPSSKKDERRLVILRMMPASAWHLMIQTQGILSPVHLYIN
jgi:hypothetical protein